MTSIALAEGSWQWVASNSEFGTYFDTETLRWDRDGSLNLWVRFFIPILEIME